MKKPFILTIALMVAFATQAQYWREIGTGSAALNANYIIYSLLTDHAGNVYAAGGFTDSASYYEGTAWVAEWNGSAWSQIGSLNANNGIYTTTMDLQGNIYAAGAFIDSNGKQYVAKWDGTQWTELGIDTAGLNVDQDIYALTTDAAGNVYAAGSFTDSVFSFGRHFYVAEWNGHWSEVGLDTTAGLNADSAIFALTTDIHGNLYAAGAFTDSAGWYYVAKWNDTAWSELGTAADSNALNANGQIKTLTTDAAGNIYAAGNFTDSSGYFYIAKWNGTNWTELHSANDAVAILGPINSLTIDSSGNVFAAGNIPDTSGAFYIVVEWNGSSLSSAGVLNANAPAQSIVSDRMGNVYAAGNFEDANGYEFVADYSAISGIRSISPNQLLIYPNPSSGIVHIQTGNNLDATVDVIDEVGRVLSSVHTPGSADMQIDLSGYTSGVYTLAIRDAGHGTLVSRIVKE